jgi:hypothetical protein
MTISRACFVVVVSASVASFARSGEAQVLDSAMPVHDADVQPAVGDAEAGAEEGGILPTSWPTIPMPKLTMPKVTMPKLTMPQWSLPKWPTNSDGIAASPFAPISAGASKVKAGTVKAWEGTKEIFSFGSKDDATQPRAPSTDQSQPSFWQRMTGQQPEPTGPQTVAEWMSQPRLAY